MGTKMWKRLAVLFTFLNKSGNFGKLIRKAVQSKLNYQVQISAAEKI